MKLFDLPVVSPSPRCRAGALTYVFHSWYGSLLRWFHSFTEPLVKKTQPVCKVDTAAKQFPGSAGEKRVRVPYIMGNFQAAFGLLGSMDQVYQHTTHPVIRPRGQKKCTRWG